MSQIELSDRRTIENESDRTWAKLMDGYVDRLGRHGCGPLKEGFRRLHFNADRVEALSDLSRRTCDVAGWQVRAVDSLLPDKEFATLISSKIFPVAAKMREPRELAFAEFPDLFHDALGHLPLLIHPAYRKFLAEYARVAKLHCHSAAAATALSRLYWHIIEVGLVREGRQLRILGAAIATSEAECQRAMCAQTTRTAFDLEKVLASAYSPFSLQPQYFILESVESLARIADSIEAAVCRFADAAAV